MEAAEEIRSHEPNLYRRFKAGEVERAIRKLYGKTCKTTEKKIKQPHFPAFDQGARDQAILASPIKSLKELQARSEPIPVEGVIDHVLDRLYPGNPLLCFGGVNIRDFGTVPRKSVRGELGYCSLIVPSPMSSPLGQRADGSGLSAHTNDNTGPRCFIVVESDDRSNMDDQAAILYHLGDFAPLVCAVFSGNKSLHGWFDVRGVPEWQVRRFFAYAVKLGADPQMWKPSQFTRLPGGWRADKEARQEAYYLRTPGDPPKSLPPPPGSVPDYDWSLEKAEEVWTDDPVVIESMSAEPLVTGLLRKGDVGVLIGGAKTLKTWIALFLAICVSLGIDFLGRRTRRTKVLYIDYELRRGTFLRRLCMLATQQPAGLDFQILRGQDPLPHLEHVEQLIVREGYGLVILDSLYRTGLIREENSNDSTSRDLTALQLLAEHTGAALLVIDHTAKGGGQDRSVVDAARGASAKGGFFDAIMVLRPHKSEAEGETRVALDAVVRDWPPQKDLPVIALKWGDCRCTVELAGTVPHDDPDLKAMRLEEILCGMGSPVGVSELMVASGLPETTVRKLLTKLESAGKVVKEPDPGHAQRALYRPVVVTVREGALRHAEGI